MVIGQMGKFFRCYIVVLSFFCGGFSHEVMTIESSEVMWTPYPVVRKEVKGRTTVRLLPMDLAIKEWVVYPPTIGLDSMATPVRIPVAKDGTHIRIDNGIGHYHWIEGQNKSSDSEFTLATVHYFSLPGPSPTAMLQLGKSRLEIIPQPVPREFSTYRAGEKWAFLVRFDQRPLRDYLVTLYTLGQLKQTFLSDAEGVVQVVMPPFQVSQTPETQSAHQTRRQVQPFQLAVEVSADAKRFTTVFQYEYGPPPLAGRHPALGWLVVGLGMAAGFAFWRGHKSEVRA